MSFALSETKGALHLSELISQSVNHLSELISQSVNHLSELISQSVNEMRHFEGMLLQNIET